MSPELSATVVVLGFGFVLLVVAAASGTTEVEHPLRIKIPEPVTQWRKPLWIVGCLLLTIGVTLVVFAAMSNDKDGPTPDAFDACASQVRQTRPTTGVDGDVAPELTSIKVAPRPVDLVATKTDVFVVHRDGRVTRIPLNDTRREIEPLRRSKKLPGPSTDAVSIAYGHESIWVVKREEGSERGVLAKISRRDGAVRHTRKIVQPDDVGVGGGAVWVIAGANLLKIDPQDSGAPAREEPIGGDPHGLLVAHPCVYVAITNPDGFAAFDTTDGKRIGTYPLGGAREVAVGAGALWMTGKSGEPRILRVDPDSPPAKAKPIRLDVAPANDALAVNQHGVWTAGGTNTVERVGPSGQRRRPLRVAGQPWAVAATNDSEFVWVAQRKGDTVTRISP